MRRHVSFPAHLLAILNLALLVPGCGGSMSETPMPLEPVPGAKPAVETVDEKEEGGGADADDPPESPVVTGEPKMKAPEPKPVAPAPKPVAPAPEKEAEDAEPPAAEPSAPAAPATPAEPVSEESAAPAAQPK